MSDNESRNKNENDVVGRWEVHVTIKHRYIVYAKSPEEVPSPRPRRRPVRHPQAAPDAAHTHAEAKPVEGAAAEHITERELVDFRPDYLLTGGAVEDLHRQVDEAVVRWKGKVAA